MALRVFAFLPYAIPELAQEQNVRAVMIFAENLERFVEWWASLVDKLTNPRLPSDQLLFLRFRAGRCSCHLPGQVPQKVWCTT
jgi:hypothetical protein